MITLNFSNNQIHLLLTEVAYVNDRLSVCAVLSWV